MMNKLIKTDQFLKISYFLQFTTKATDYPTKKLMSLWGSLTHIHKWITYYKHIVDDTISHCNNNHHIPPPPSSTRPLTLSSVPTPPPPHFFVPPPPPPHPPPPLSPTLRISEEERFGRPHRLVSFFRPHYILSPSPGGLLARRTKIGRASC